MIPITAYFRCAGDDSMLSQDWQRPGQPAERDPANASEGPVLRARRGLPKRPARGSSARHWANASPCQFWIDIEGNESARGSMRRANRRTQATAWARATSGRRGRRGLRTDERALREGGSHCVATRVHIPLLGFCRQTNDAGDTKGLAMSQAGDSRAERRT